MPAIPRAFDPAGLDQTFTFWTIVPPQGVFQGIGELPPGHVRIYEAGGVRETRVLEAPLSRRRPAARRQFTGSLDDAVEAVRSALEAATALRMLRADVPVGSYLSGGLDSSLVAALGQRSSRASASRPSRCASTTPSTTRPPSSA